MASDQKAVVQRPIIIRYEGKEPFRTIADMSIPEPPNGCESQQLFDWAVLCGVIPSNMPMVGKMRLVEAYSERHPSVVVKEYEGGEWPPPPESRDTL